MRWMILFFATTIFNIFLLTNAAFFSMVSGFVQNLAPGMMASSMYAASMMQKQKLTTLQAKNANLASKNTLLNRHQTHLNQKLNTLNQKQKRLQKLVSTKASNISKRIRATTLAGLKRMPAEAVPVVGLSVLLGGIAYDISQGCHNMEELNQILTLIEAPPENALSSDLCQIKIPTLEELKQQIKN